MVHPFHKTYRLSFKILRATKYGPEYMLDYHKETDGNGYLLGTRKSQFSLLALLSYTYCRHIIQSKILIRLLQNNPM